MVFVGGEVASSNKSLPKSPTGIQGLDEITGGGLPEGRPTLVCGSAGCGKTLLSMEFLFRGAMQYDEPGVFMSFEETSEELAQNVASLGFDVDSLVADSKLAIDYVYIERSQIEETGNYDLEALFIRLGFAIDSIGAKRVVIDSPEALFAGLSDYGVLRAEFRRLFRWLKDKGVTAVITGERGLDGALTRHGLEEYISDCVILLDHRVSEQISIRRLRIVKYRGSVHGTDEYPFLINENGISVMPVTSLRLDHQASTERISSGVKRLDDMLEGKGFYRGSTVLLSGTAGTGKTSLSVHFADATCRNGERCLYFGFEESESQVVRNARSIGIDLEPWISNGLLHFRMARPTFGSLERHLIVIHNLVNGIRPAVVILDPITNFLNIGNPLEVKSLLVRLIDFLKQEQVTALFTSLTKGGDVLEDTEVGVSSLIDTWILLRDIEMGGERNRGLYVLKSRGMAHSNQIREFLLTNNGIQLLDVYLGTEGALTGSARLAQEAREQRAELEHQQGIARVQIGLERKRKALEAQIAAMRTAFAAEEEEMMRDLSQHQEQERNRVESRLGMSRSRKAGVLPANKPARRKKEAQNGQ